MLFKRVIDHLLNQVLVETLANSTWFQRFAVRTNEKVQALKQSSKGNAATVDQHLNSFWEMFNSRFSNVRKQFEEEYRKIDEASRQVKR